MATIHERLRKAAEAGSEVELKAFLRDPGRDALAKDGQGMTGLMYAAWSGHVACIEILLPASNALTKSHHGMTALMGASWNGHEACVRLLLPASAPLAKARDGFTAGEMASRHGHEGLARFIDAYALAQSEQVALGVAVRVGPRADGRPYECEAWRSPKLDDKEEKAWQRSMND